MNSVNELIVFYSELELIKSIWQRRTGLSIGANIVCFAAVINSINLNSSAD